MTSKKPWESKTIVLNAILGICGVVALFYPNASVVSTFINANGVMIATIWSILNIVLRSVSKDQIVLTD